MITLKKGDSAPLFDTSDHNGNPISLKGFKGKKVALYFYPKDDTPGCTAQACNLRDNYNLLLSQGYVVLGVSPDGMAKHQKFAAKYNLPFPLIPDSERTIIEAYGVWGPKKLMGRTYDGVHRTTFLINEEGLIERVIEKVETSDHARQLMEG